ncbi:ABC transporter permease subunit [Halobellus sp. GM3]|uniref:ABC transporter permease subunit n=1 Tax=Halobellus sp. GM3 TaxID=3458410 RepID=UPI00403DA447
MPVKFILKRLGRYFLVLFSLLTIIFFMFRVMPGDPTAMLVTGTFSDEARQSMLEQFGLNQPLHEQYYLFLVNALRGDLGVSFFYQDPVLSVLYPRLLNTLIIMLPGMSLVVLGAYVFGARLGWEKGSFKERLGSYTFLSLRAIPHFVTGLVLLMIFSYWLGWFPTGGMGPISAENAGAKELVTTPSLYKYAVLPFLTVILHYLSDPYLLMRGNMVTQRSADYIGLHRLKGLHEEDIRNHAAKNSLLPLVTYSATLVAIAFGGVILIEVVFSWPGIGRELILAVNRQDYPLAQAAFMLIGVIVITANLLIDLLYGYLDPRITYGRS